MVVPLLALALMQSPPPGERGSDLFRNCRAAIREIESSTGGVDTDLGPGLRCSDYIGGLADGMSHGHLACFGEATKETMVRVYVSFMETHPTYMDQHQANGFYAAMLQTYPCTIKVK